MTSLFDGMSGILSGMFGAPVAVQPVTGAPYTVQGVFRLTPIEVATEEGFAVLERRPTLQVQRDLARFARGDLVTPSIAGGAQYRVANAAPNVSPAADGFVLYELELVP